MQTDIKIIKLRLKNTKKISNLIFLEENTNKINEAYLNLKIISKFVSKELVDFQVI